MTPLHIASLAVLVAIATLASYIQRVYSEFGKILSREDQENLDAWEERIEPHLGLSREHARSARRCCSSLRWASSRWSSARCSSSARRTWARRRRREIAQSVLAVVLVVVFAYQLIPVAALQPHARTVGGAAAVAHPAAALAGHAGHGRSSASSFLVVALAEAPASSEEEPAPDVEDLIEAGEEEGILEQSDRELVRSAVEFGDMLVREVMTPRPEIFAIEESITLERFLELLREHNYSRVPVYAARSTTSPVWLSRTTFCRSPTSRRARARWRRFCTWRSSCRKPSAATNCCARCSAKNSTCAS